MLQLNQSGVPQRVQVFFLAVESHVNTVATAILCEAGMQRLMDVADDAGLVFLDAQDYLFIDQEEL